MPEQNGPPTGVWLAAVTSPPARPVVDDLAAEDTARPNVLVRWALTEPVRLYLAGIVAVIVGGLQLAGWLSGDWVEYAISSAAVVLGIGAGSQALRAQVYSPAGTVQAIRAGVRAAGRR